MLIDRNYLIMNKYKKTDFSVEFFGEILLLLLVVFCPIYIFYDYLMEEGKSFVYIYDALIYINLNTMIFPLAFSFFFTLLMNYYMTIKNYTISYRFYILSLTMSLFFFTLSIYFSVNSLFTLYFLVNFSFSIKLLLNCFSFVSIILVCIFYMNSYLWHGFGYSIIFLSVIYWVRFSSIDIFYVKSLLFLSILVLSSFIYFSLEKKIYFYAKSDYDRILFIGQKFNFGQKLLPNEKLYSNLNINHIFFVNILISRILYEFLLVFLSKDVPSLSLYFFSDFFLNFFVYFILYNIIILLDKYRSTRSSQSVYKVMCSEKDLYVIWYESIRKGLLVSCYHTMFFLKFFSLKLVLSSILFIFFFTNLNIVNDIVIVLFFSARLLYRILSKYCI